MPQAAATGTSADAAAGDQDPVRLLYQACREDVFPTDIACLQAFHFDRVLDWSYLLGLYQGMLMIHVQNDGLNDNLHEFDRERTRRQMEQSDAKRQAELRQAIAEGRLLEYVEDLYEAFKRENDYPGSGYWHWYLQQKALIKTRAHAARTPARVGHRVQLKGLQARPELNRASGKVVSVDAASGRLAVRVDSPPSAVAAVPEGVRVRRDNADVLPAGATQAVMLAGKAVGAALAFGTSAKDGWKVCPLPARLGMPLAYTQLSQHRHDDEQLAYRLCTVPSNGSAPREMLQFGAGTILVARTDGRDFTVEEMLELHEYNKHLAAVWDKTPGPVMQQQMLTPAAFQAFTEARKQEAAAAMAVD